jgi:hypothetical protein
MQKKSAGVILHYLDIWLAAHDDDATTAEKLVSSKITCYA